MSIIAQRDWQLLYPKVGYKNLLITIYAPIPAEDPSFPSHAICVLEINDRKSRVRGVDSWHAIRMALDGAKTYVATLEKKRRNLLSSRWLTRWIRYAVSISYEHKVQIEMGSRFIDN